jgi:hypothetical protein
MKTGIAVIFLLLALAAATAFASGCFLKYSYVSGMNRICVYDCISGEKHITIGSCDICPLSL